MPAATPGAERANFKFSFSRQTALKSWPEASLAWHTVPKSRPTCPRKWQTAGVRWVSPVGGKSVRCEFRDLWIFCWNCRRIFSAMCSFKHVFVLFFSCSFLCIRIVYALFLSLIFHMLNMHCSCRHYYKKHVYVNYY